MMDINSYISENCRIPVYNPTSQLWVLEYKIKDYWEQREFITSVSAWVFYYEIVNKLKCKFIQKQQSGKIK